MQLTASAIRARITRYPQAYEMVNTELARQGWYPERPIGGSLALLAALIGSLVNDMGSESSRWMLGQAAEYLFAN